MPLVMAKNLNLFSFLLVFISLSLTQVALSDYQNANSGESTIGRWPFFPCNQPNPPFWCYYIPFPQHEPPPPPPPHHHKRRSRHSEKCKSSEKFIDECESSTLDIKTPETMANCCKEFHKLSKKCLVQNVSTKEKQLLRVIKTLCPNPKNSPQSPPSEEPSLPTPSPPPKTPSKPPSSPPPKSNPPVKPPSSPSPPAPESEPSAKTPETPPSSPSLLKESSPPPSKSPSSPPSKSNPRAQSPSTPSPPAPEPEPPTKTPATQKKPSSPPSKPPSSPPPKSNPPSKSPSTPSPPATSPPSPSPPSGGGGDDGSKSTRWKKICIEETVQYNSCDPGKAPKVHLHATSQEQGYIPQQYAMGSMTDNVTGCCLAFAIFTNGCNESIKDMSFAKNQIYSTLENTCSNTYGPGT